MNGKLKPAVLLNDPDTPSPQVLSVFESPHFSLLFHESTCEEQIYILSRNHSSLVCWHCIIIITGPSAFPIYILSLIIDGSYLPYSYPLLPLSIQQLAFVDIVPVWCLGWHLFWIVSAHVIRVIRYFKWLPCLAVALTASHFPFIWLYPCSPHVASHPTTKCFLQLNLTMPHRALALRLPCS